MSELRCYHHCNSEEHPAVAYCSSCGKGLCRECADKLSSPNTGKLLCADCLNKELEDDRRRCLAQKERAKKEAIMMVLGLALGIVIEIILGVLYANNDDSSLISALFVLSFVFFLPTLLASLSTIVSTVKRTFYNILLRIVFFFILSVVSPIMFIVRLTRRIRSQKTWKDLAVAVESEQDANNKYKEAAMNITDRRVSLEEIERKLREEYNRKVAAMELTHEEAERKIVEEAQRRLDEANRQHELEQEEARRKSAEQAKILAETEAKRQEANSRVEMLERENRRVRNARGRENSEAA